MLRNIFLKIYIRHLTLKNLNSLVREVEGDLMREMCSVCELGDSAALRMSILPKLLHRFSVFSKSHQMFYIEIESWFKNLYWNAKNLE